MKYTIATILAVIGMFVGISQVSAASVQSVGIVNLSDTQGNGGGMFMHVASEKGYNIYEVYTSPRIASGVYTIQGNCIVTLVGCQEYTVGSGEYMIGQPAKAYTLRGVVLAYGNLNVTVNQSDGEQANETHGYIITGQYAVWYAYEYNTMIVRPVNVSRVYIPSVSK